LLKTYGEFVVYKQKMVANFPVARKKTKQELLKDNQSNSYHKEAERLY